jgi:hypothetical protein
MKREVEDRAIKEPAFYDEMKKRVGISVTPTALEGFDEHATTWDVSKSELIERIGRGIIPLQSPRRSSAWGILSQYKAQLLDQLNGLGQYKGRKAKGDKQPSFIS